MDNRRKKYIKKRDLEIINRRKETIKKRDLQEINGIDLHN